MPSSIEIDLQIISEQLDSRVWTIQKLFSIFKGKEYSFLNILISIPFCQPIQIPGFSIPFDVIIFFVRMRMAFRKRILWPKWIQKKISTKVLKVVINKSLSFFQFLRPLLHPRWGMAFNACLGSEIILGDYYELYCQ